MSRMFARRPGLFPMIRRWVGESCLPGADRRGGVDPEARPGRPSRLRRSRRSLARDHEAFRVGDSTLLLRDGVPLQPSSSEPIATRTACPHRPRCRTCHADGYGGSNSHKGAIWILGLLISAAAMQIDDEAAASAIADTAKAVACFADRAAPRLVSHGDLVAKKHGVKGARGEALCGFPHVVNIGLPMLHSRRSLAQQRTSLASTRC